MHTGFHDIYPLELFLTTEYFIIPNYFALEKIHVSTTMLSHVKNSLEPSLFFPWKTCFFFCFFFLQGTCTIRAQYPSFTSEG